MEMAQVNKLVVYTSVQIVMVQILWILKVYDIQVTLLEEVLKMYQRNSMICTKKPEDVIRKTVSQRL